mgnify:CR=1 FL=1
MKQRHLGAHCFTSKSRTSGLDGSGGAFSDLARPLEKNFSGTDASDEERNLRIFFYEPIMQIVDFRPLHS